MAVFRPFSGQRKVPCSAEIRFVESRKDTPRFQHFVPSGDGTEQPAKTGDADGHRRPECGSTRWRRIGSVPPLLESSNTRPPGALDASIHNTRA